jgi:hypothetical protein
MRLGFFIARDSSQFNEALTMNPSLDGGASGSIRAGGRKLSRKLNRDRQLPGYSTMSSFVDNSNAYRRFDGIEGRIRQSRRKISKAFWSVS